MPGTNTILSVFPLSKGKVPELGKEFVVVAFIPEESVGYVTLAPLPRDKLRFLIVSRSEIISAGFAPEAPTMRPRYCAHSDSPESPAPFRVRRYKWPLFVLFLLGASMIQSSLYHTSVYLSPSLKQESITSQDFGLLAARYAGS